MKKKLTSLANVLLKFFVMEYYETHKDMFPFEMLQSRFSKYDDDFICDALRLLDDDGFVHVFWAGDVAYTTTLDVSAVRSADEDTWYKRGYTFMKELRQWL